MVDRSRRPSTETDGHLGDPGHPGDHGHQGDHGHHDVDQDRLTTATVTGRHRTGIVGPGHPHTGIKDQIRIITVQITSPRHPTSERT